MASITLVDWHDDFIDALLELLVAHGTEQGSACGDFRRVSLLFPHQRPRRYLVQRMQASGYFSGPVLAPRMYSVSQWVSTMRVALDPQPRHAATVLDMAGLLFDSVCELDTTAGSLLTTLPLERDRFFPWGLLLAELFEECARHFITPRDLQHIQDEVHPMAAALLEQLGSIFTRFDEKLAAKAWTTPGRDLYWAAQNSERITQALAGQHIFLAGMDALTGAQERLYQSLFNRQILHPVLHTDCRLLTQPEKAHWSCKEHHRWIRRWKARPVLFTAKKTRKEKKPCNITFTQGFDLHSQLASLRALLTKDKPENAAIILPDTSTLLPVLHHLPDKAVNISMGYPLARSNLMNLLENILRLQETARETRLYDWQDILTLIRHPYIQMLTPGGTELAPVLREMEQFLRTGEKYVDPFAWQPEELAAGSVSGQKMTGQSEQALCALHKVLHTCCTQFESLRTLAELAGALQNLMELLLPEDIPAAWHAFPVDAHCLYCLGNSVLPVLMNSGISHEQYARSVLFSILRQLTARERVPFEADPLTGLQVMGILESRLLPFDRVYILDAVEGTLPATPSWHPLLPDPLRHLLGLPDGQKSVQVSAHTFFRLVNSAHAVHILYATGVSSTGQPGMKNIRSRFVEELVWEKEQEQGSLAAQDDMVNVVRFPLAPVPHKAGHLARTPAVQELLEKKVREQALSATALDTYLHCPLHFFYRYLTRLKEPATVQEQGDPAGLGSAVHNALRDFFTPWVGVPLDTSRLQATQLSTLFTEHLHAQTFFHQMRADRRIRLERTGKKRLEQFLRTQIHAGAVTSVCIQALEKEYQAGLPYDRTPDDMTGQAGSEGGQCLCTLRGTPDRIDQREKKLIILDYKTGNISNLINKKTFWTATDSALWEAIADLAPAHSPALLEEINSNISSIQLPLYGWLYWKNTGTVPANAALVEMYAKGEEKMFLPKSNSASQKTARKKQPEESGPDSVSDMAQEIFTLRVPHLIRYLVHHMLTAEAFFALPGKQCSWCVCAGACGAARALPEKGDW